MTTVVEATENVLYKPNSLEISFLPKIIRVAWKLRSRATAEEETSCILDSKWLQRDIALCEISAAHKSVGSRGSNIVTNFGKQGYGNRPSTVTPVDQYRDAITYWCACCSAKSPIDVCHTWLFPCHPSPSRSPTLLHLNFISFSLLRPHLYSYCILLGNPN